MAIQIALGLTALVLFLGLYFFADRLIRINVPLKNFPWAEFENSLSTLKLTHRAALAQIFLTIGSSRVTETRFFLLLFSMLFTVYLSIRRVLQTAFYDTKVQRLCVTLEVTTSSALICAVALYFSHRWDVLFIVWAIFSVFASYSSVYVFEIIHNMRLNRFLSRTKLSLFEFLRLFFKLTEDTLLDDSKLVISMLFCHCIDSEQLRCPSVELLRIIRE